MVAVDFAVAAVEPLAASAPPRVTARLGDMRDLAAVLPEPTTFDGAWCMGNSFGYLDAAATDRFLAGVAQVLRPSAHFLIDVATAAESILPHLDTGDTARAATRSATRSATCHSPTRTGTTRRRRRS